MIPVYFHVESLWFQRLVTMDVYSGVVLFLVAFNLCLANDWLTLCPEEKRSPTIFADVGDNITFTVCVIHDGGLTLKEVYCKNLCSCQYKFYCDLPKEQFSSTMVRRDGGHKDYFDLIISVDRIQERFFGILWLIFSSDQKRLGTMVQFAKKGLAFNSYDSDMTFDNDGVQKYSELYLMCESSDYPPSSLSIVRKYSKEILDTKVVDGVMVYHIKSVECLQLGIYVCFVNNDTSQNATLDLEVLYCPPQLCYEENKPRTVIASLYNNVSIEICVITATWSSLVLHSVFRYGISTDNLLERKYESSLSSTKTTKLSHWKVNVMLRDIQENDFGKISIKMCDSHWRKTCLIYEMVLKKPEIEFKNNGSVDSGKSLHLTCKPSGYHPSSLMIVKFYNWEILHTTVIDGNLVYLVERLQCSDMGTYVCFHINGTSTNATVNVKAKSCPPQLCQVESRNRTIYALLNDNVIVDICVISWGSPSLISVFRNDNKTDKLLKSRYEYSSISPMASQELYWKVIFVLGDVQEEDFGSISLNISSMIYVMVLAKKESAEDYSLIISALSACLAVVVLILVAIFIYLKIRKPGSRTPTSHHQIEIPDRQPVSSQQMIESEYSVPRYENAFAEQLHAMFQETDDDGYPEPGPVYETI